MIRYVVIAGARTGSTFLGQQLNKHLEIRHFGESFNPGGIRFRTRDGSHNTLPELHAELTDLRNRDPNAFLERLYLLDTTCRIVGFKMAPQHFPDILDRLVADPAVKKVLHYRPNSLARWASRMAAREVDAFGRTAKRPLVTFSARRFINDHNAHATFYRDIVQRLTQTRQAFALSRYNDINNRETMTALTRFLGTTRLPRARASETERARGSANILQRFSNPEIVEKFLRRRCLMHWAVEGDERPSASAPPLADFHPLREWKIAPALPQAFASRFIVPALTS